MSDIDFGKGTWHVYDDGSLRVYANGNEIARIVLRNDQMLKMATDLIRVARALA